MQRNALAELEKCRTSGDGMEQEEDMAAKELLQKLTQSFNDEEKVEENPIGNQTMSRVINQCGRSNIPQRSLSMDSSSTIERIKKRKTSTSNLTNGSSTKTQYSLPLPGLHSLYRRQEGAKRSLAPMEPKGELIKLKPRLVTPASSLPEHKKTKPPKFVPYEPYPGAINPLVPEKANNSDSRKMIKRNKNNLDIHVLVSQMSTIRTHELQESQVTVPVAESTKDLSELENLKAKLKKTSEERDYYQGQFKFQTQVNAELKNLLVASVGEDLLTRVNVLTEDKLQLARALLDTANNLTTHTEQIEFLAGQCEVWRSKFLASSVMVEELARWKADLTQKNQMLTESTKQLLHATHQLRDMQLEILKNLKFLAKIRYLNLPASDVITLSAENLNILQQMVLHTGVGMPDGNLNISTVSTSPLCEAEKYAVQSLDFISQPLMATDEAIKALFGQTQRPFNTPAKCSLEKDETSTGTQSK
uniref:Golgin-45 n=1 Tax=Glossina palpalis gambiensis TaxID=67801 RepID=A0A1B0BB86_9MUSC